MVQYHATVRPLLGRLLDLLGGFIARPHAELAAVGVAALARLTLSLVSLLGPGQWDSLLTTFRNASEQALPDIAGLMKRRHQERFGASSYVDESSGMTDELPTANAAVAVPAPPSSWSLGRGAGARRLAEVRVRIHVSLLLVQAAQAICKTAAEDLPPAAAAELLDLLESTAKHARRVDADVSLRHGLALAQAADGVPSTRCLPDPPLLTLEAEAAEAYVDALGALSDRSTEDVKVRCALRDRLAQQCLASLARYEDAAREGAEGAVTTPNEAAALAPLAVTALRVLRDAFDDGNFREHARDLFPHLVALVAVEGAPPELRQALAEVFLRRVGALLVA